MTLPGWVDDSTALLGEFMKYDVPKSGVQTRPCTQCEGTMEMRLGMWDCNRCGHQAAPAAEPAPQLKQDPALSINRARLLRRPDPAEGSTSQAGSPGTLYSQSAEDSGNALMMKMMCLGAFVMLNALAHFYILLNGSVNSWVETDYILGRVVAQLVYLAIVSVGIFWLEKPPKYFALLVSVLVFFALLTRAFIAAGIVGTIELYDSPWLPKTTDLYWYLSAAFQLGLTFWQLSLGLSDLSRMEQR